jgi:hypothetical protein
MFAPPRVVEHEEIDGPALALRTTHFERRIGA